MNRYEQFIAEFLTEYKEVSLEKIGNIKITGESTDTETHLIPVDFTFDKKAVTTPELIDFIATKTSKNRMLVSSDLESHFTQAKEFINIGKSYEILNVGFIKKNNSGSYEFVPYSQALKAQKNFSQPSTKTKQTRKKGAYAVQLFTLLIVLAILGGLGWEAYQFFLKRPAQNTTASETELNPDTVKNNVTVLNKDSSQTAGDTTQTIKYNDNDSVLVKYLYETTNLLIRARSRTDKLKSFGNRAGYDSTADGSATLYSLYILKKTRITDTLTVKDSLAKFLQKDVRLKIMPTQ